MEEEVLNAMSYIDHSWAPRIGTLSAARYLLSTKPPEFFHIELQSDDTIQNYLLHLSNEKAWLGYKNYIFVEIKKMRKELSDMDISDPDDKELHAQTQKHLDQLILQEKNTRKIDALIHDGNLQESLIMNNEKNAKTILTMDEMINHSHDYIEKIDEMEKTETVMFTNKWICSIPLIHDFVRGLNYLSDAYKACRDSKIQQRKMKIFAGVFGILVGLFFWAGIGIIAAISFLYAMFIVIFSLAIGVYSTALFRDGYVLYLTRKQLKKMQNEVNKIDSDIIQIKEIIISNYVNQLEFSPSNAEIKNIQDAIKLARAQLVDKATKSLCLEITELCIERNEMIMQHIELQENIAKKFNDQTDLARLSFEKMNLVYSLNQLSSAREEARKKFIVSTLSCMAFVLGLIAVCLNGVDVLAVFGVGAALLLGATLAKLCITYEEEKKKFAVSPTPAYFNHEKPQSNEFQFDKVLLNEKQPAIAAALKK